MRRLKIAQVSPKYFPSIGGVETHVKEISERLVARGFEVQVLTTDYNGNLPVQNYQNYTYLEKKGLDRAIKELDIRVYAQSLLTMVKKLSKTN